VLSQRVSYVKETNSSQNSQTKQKIANQNFKEVFLMSKVRKFLAMAIVFAMVLGIMAPAFALSSDIVGTEYEDAAALLGALNIMVGDAETGNFRPNDNIKRSEFAKIAVLALGLGSAADAAKGATQFPDVVQNHWASGYINVAAGQGIIIGDDTGNFRPDDNISYAEALTVLVRALGYKDSFLTGAWPSNFIAKAAELGITKGVNVYGSTAAIRGNVAKMLVNTLDAKVIKVDTYEGSTVKYYESSKTLLEDKLNIKKYEDAKILANKRIDDGLEAHEVTVSFTKEIRDADNRVVYEAGTIKNFETVNSLNVEPVLGEEVTVYFNSDNELIYAKKENDDKAKFDFVKEIKTGTDGNISKISLAAFDGDYAFAENAVVYVLSNNKYINVVAAGTNYLAADMAAIAGHFGKFVVKNNKIVYAEIIDGSETAPWLLVTDNDNSLIKGINTTDENYELDLTSDGNFDGVIVLDTGGNIVDIADIEAGNILYVQKQSYNGDDYAVVRVVNNNKVEGTLDKIKSDKIYLGNTDITVQNYKLNGTTYYSTFYSVNNGENVKEWNGTDWADDMKDASDENVVAYTDGVGRVAYFTTEAKATSGYKYGIVTKIFNESEKLKVYTLTGEGKGDEITYAVENPKYDASSKMKAMPLNDFGQMTSSTYTADHILAVGDVIKFKLNKDGEIAENELYVATTLWALDSANNGKGFGKDSIPAELASNADVDKVFSVDEDIVIIDAKNAGPSQDTDDFGIVKWEAMKEDNYNAGYRFYVFAKDSSSIDLDAVVFVGTLGADSSSDAKAIYVIDKWTKGGDSYVQYAIYDGSIAETKVASGLNQDERAYAAKVKSDGSLELLADDGDFSAVYGVVYNKNGNIITLETSAGVYETYKLSGSKTVVYEEDDKKSVSNIKKGDAVYFIVENGINVRVVEKLKGSEAAAVKTFANPY
jgi:hypothetical protein